MKSIIYHICFYVIAMPSCCLVASAANNAPIDIPKQLGAVEDVNAGEKILEDTIEEIIEKMSESG